MLFIEPLSNNRFRGKANDRALSVVLPNILALLLLSVGACGCISSRTAANRIVDAPNHHAQQKSYREMTNLWASLQAVLNQHGITNSYIHDLTNSARFLTVPVGPPPADLKVAELPPKD